MSQVIAREVQKLEMASDEAFVTLYELEIFVGTEPIYLHAENTEEDIKFNNGTGGTQPKVYKAFPMVMEGVETRGDGAQNRPSITIPNIESVFTSGSIFDSDPTDNENDFELDDVIGKRITRRRTLSKYIQVGSGTAPTNHFQFPKAVYVVDRIASKTSLSIEFELASPFDLEDVKVPSRIVTGKYCPWVYKQWTESNSDVKSACYWKNSLNDGTTQALLFFTIDDEPLVLQDTTSTSAPKLLFDRTHTQKVADAGGNTAVTYGQNGFAFHNNQYFQALKSGVTGPPTVGSSFRRVRTYSIWSPTIPYTPTTSSDEREGPYVYDNGAVYRCIRQVTNKVPANSPAFWMEADVCGKLLSSCKSRYQAKLIIKAAQNSGDTGYNFRAPMPLSVQDRGTATNGTANGPTRKHAAPKVDVTTNIKLPFGGFPGTRRIR